jgi:hypothetical protein
MPWPPIPCGSRHCARNAQPTDAGHGRGRLPRRRRSLPAALLLREETGPDEYQTLADLPPIPPSFDEPADGVAPALSPTEPEGTP